MGPLSVGAEEFSPEIKSLSRVAARPKSDGSIDELPSRTGPGKIIGRREAVGSTTAVEGVAALIGIAGQAAPAVAGTRFLAVAEVHSSAVDIEGAPSIISTDGHRSAVVLDTIVATRKGGGLMKEMSVLEPLDHSVLALSPEGGDVHRDEVVGLHPLEHSGVDRSAELMEGTSSLELLEHSVPKVSLDEGGQSIGSKTASDPLERAGASSVGKLLSAPGPTMYLEGAGDGRCRVRDPGGVDGTLPDVRKEANQVPLEEGEAIVVGAIGSAAPWFLTGRRKSS